MKKTKKVISYLLIISIFISTITFYPINEVYAISNQNEFEEWLIGRGIEIYNRVERTLRVNYNTFKNYNLIVYGSPSDVPNNDTKYSDETGRIEPRYLGYTVEGINDADRYRNTTFPPDRWNKTSPIDWNYLEVPGAKKSWEQISNTDIKNWMKSISLYHLSTDYDPRLTVNYINSKDGYTGENKVKLQNPPTWKNYFTVYINHKQWMKEGYWKTWYAVYDGKPLGGNTDVEGEIVTDSDTYTITNTDDSITIPITVNANALLEGMALITDIKEISAEYDSVVNTDTKVKNVSVTVDKEYKRSNLNIGENILELKATVTLISSFDDKYIKTVTKQIKINVEEKSSPYIEVVGGIHPESVQFDNTDTNILVNVKGTINNVKNEDVDKWIFYADSKQYTLNTQQISANWSFPFTIPKEDVVSDKFINTYDLKAECYLKDGRVFEGTDKVNILIYKTPPEPPIIIEENESPVASISSSSSVKAGDLLHIRSTSYDPDGTIEEYNWNINSANGSITDDEGDIWYDYTQVGDNGIDLSVVDDNGASDSTSKSIRVLTPTPEANISIKGSLKENRKVTLSADKSISPLMYPIVHNLNDWEIEGMDLTDIKYVGNIDGKSTFDVLFKSSGDISAFLEVANTLGYTGTDSEILKIEPDLPPIADFDTITTIYRNPEDYNIANIEVHNKSYSEDGDKINNLKIAYIYDENNDGVFSEAQKIVYDSINIDKFDFDVQEVGKYKIIVYVKEDFGQPTIESFISESDYRSDDTLDKPIDECVVEVKNYAPYADVQLNKKVNMDIIFSVDENYNEVDLNTKIDSILKPILDENNMSANISIIKHQTAQIQTESMNIQDTLNNTTWINDNRYFVVVNNKDINDFNNIDTLTKLTKDNINLIGFGNNLNKNTFNNLLELNDYKGKYIENTNIDSSLLYLGNYITNKRVVDLVINLEDTKYSLSEVQSKVNNSLLPKLNSENIELNLSIQDGEYILDNNTYFIIGNTSNANGTLIQYNTKTKEKIVIDTDTLRQVTPIVDIKGNVYYKSYSTGSIYKYNPIRSEITELTVAKYTIPISSSNDGKVYFKKGEMIYQYDIENNNYTLIYENPNPSYAQLQDIFIGYDNNLYYKLRSSSNGMIYKFDLNTNKSTYLFGNQYYNENYIFDSNNKMYNSSSVSVYTTIDSYDLDTKTKTNITTFGGVGFYIKDNKIYFGGTNNIYAEHQQGIHMYDIDNGEAKTLYDADEIVLLGFSNDKSIYYVKRAERSPYKATYYSNIYRFDIEKGEEELLTDIVTIGYDISYNKIAEFPYEFVYAREPYTIKKQLEKTYWRTATNHMLVNFNDNPINALNDSIERNNIISNLTNDNIHFIGFGNSTNESQINNLVADNKGKGMYLDNSNLDTAFDQLADYIINNTEQRDLYIKDYVLLNEEVEYRTLYSDKENDSLYKEKWKFIHSEPNYFENGLGLLDKHNMYIDNAITRFNKKGKIDVKYMAQDNPKDDIRFDNYRLWSLESASNLSLYVHVKPNASFSIDIKDGELIYKDTSHDKDHMSLANKGIVDSVWKYKKSSDKYWTKGKLSYSDIEPDTVYFVGLKVKDMEGEWSEEFIVDFDIPSDKIIQIQAKAKGKDNKFNINNIPASEYLTAYDVLTTYPFEEKLEVAIYDTTLLKSTIKEVLYSETTATGNGKSVNWFDVDYQIPATLPDGNYTFKISGIDAIDNNIRTDIDVPIIVNTPINLSSSLSVLAGGETNIIQAITSIYVNTVNVEVFKGTSNASTIDMKLKSNNGIFKTWEITYNTPDSTMLPAGNYQAKFTATTPNGNLEILNRTFELQNFKITSTGIWGDWNHWQGQVDLFGKTLVDMPHRFMGYEKIHINVIVDGSPDYVDVSFSPDLEAMFYTNSQGHTYSYADHVGYTVSFPLRMNTIDNRNFNAEYILPIAKTTINDDNQRLRSPYWIKVTAHKGTLESSMIMNDIDITGNILNKIYLQPE